MSSPVESVVTQNDSTMLIVGSAIFILTYLAIALEKRIKVDKTVSAMLGSSLMMFFVLRKVVSHDGLGAYSRFVDFDVIFLLAGMMVIVNILRETGIFQYIAIKCVKTGRGKPIPALILMLVATAIMSAFLDNVTTVLLMVPVTMLVAAELKLDPIPFLIPEILASNIGGTATLIGDPPNILVGSYVTKLSTRMDWDLNFDFLTFMKVMTPLIFTLMAVFLGIIFLRMKNAMHVTAEERARIMELNERRAITNPAMLKKGLFVMALTLAGFMLHGMLHLEPGVVAMGGAALMLILSRADVEKTLSEIEWNTLFFFLGLFIVVNGAVEAGLMTKMSESFMAFIGKPDDIAYSGPVLVLWISGILAGIMNNVSYTAAALPVVENLCEGFGLLKAQSGPMWWALALGACLGGNLTPVGAAANLVVINIAAKNNQHITFGRFLKWGIPCAIGSLIFATGYVLILSHLAQP